ncbi:hypothetical protein [uncultured Propionibacterium sp.]|uniref:hypothetical protein n=1 Tax=uncultured Propionibacterium sp. TaxID=218066 RepID=UPI002930F9C5|nr:hypothetical protein [uncultured Propionibacterium sp.]
MSADPRLATAAAYALGGEAASRIDPTRIDSPAGLVARLDRAGWTAAGLREFRNARRAETRRWPVPVPDDVRSGLGSARLHAWVAQCVSLLDLDAIDSGVRDHSQPFDREDLRLMGERPPHHGAVG